MNKQSWSSKLALALCGAIGPSTVVFASSCTDAALGTTTVSGACAALIKVLMGSCTVATATGGVELLSTITCSLAAFAASIACGMSVPAIIGTVIKCLGG